MRRRRAALLGWTMWVVGLVGMVAGALVDDRNPPISTTNPPESLAAGIVWLSSWVGFGLVGALVVSSRPSNRIGWMLSGITASAGLIAFTGAYGRYALITASGTLPLGRTAAWLSAWAILVPVMLMMFVVLSFPTGSTSTRMGRFVAQAFLFLGALDLVAFALRPGPVQGDTPPDNPLGVPGADHLLSPAISVLGNVLALLALVGIFDLFARFRRSRGSERQQYRWFFAAVATFPILFTLASVLEVQIIGEDGLDPTVLVFPLWGNGTAAAIALAITRHGLYEIDRIISRAVSYGLVIALLALVFSGVVALLTSFLPAESPVAVAGSTLVVAALFNPVRRRIQVGVDHRFNRSRYDVERVMDEFSALLRDGVDPDVVLDGLVGVVADTMEPTTVAVWVRAKR